MFSYQVDIYEKQNGAWGWHTLSGWTRPFTDGTRLDETLDSGTINLSNVTRDKAIKPFTRLRIIVSENNVEKERIYRLVASTRSKRKRYAGTPLYDWTINTIELTKLLERRLIDTLTVTKYLTKDYASGYTPASYTAASFNSQWTHLRDTPTYYTPYKVGETINIINPAKQIYWTDASSPSDNSTCTVSVYADGVAGQTFTTSGADTSTYIGTYTFPAEAEYTISVSFSGNVVAPTPSGYVFRTDEYYFKVNCYTQLAEKTDPTISSVCNRLLSAGTTRRKSVESQEFLIDPTFESEYANVLSPEFSFTNSTLFEALLQIGNHIHAIPRLVPRSTSDDTHYYVTFDKLGGDEQAPTMPPLIYSESTIDVNDWCGQIDTPAQNLVNTEDVNAGSITELGNSFITVRTEDGQVEMNGDNVCIRTSQKQQQILKLELGCIPQYDNGNTPVGDITPYLYESAEYKTLSSYWGASYPYSKGWALYYTQGGDTIEGLTNKVTGATQESSASKNFSIVNIINAKTGLNITPFSTSAAAGSFMCKLAFRVTYVPIAQARVKAHKPSLAEGGAVNNALTYNQSANIAETSYYGEKMRGAIARLGHDVETRTYDIFHYAQLPKIGQLLDGKYIAHIDYEWDITKVRITVALTKDFNMLSQFVGLNSNYRLYDISEKQSVERSVNYDELIVLSKKRPNVDMGRYMMMRDVAGNISYELIGTAENTTTPKKMSVAKLTPYDENSQEITNRACILPAVAFPFGTSIALNVSYFDNYGAGYQQSNAYESETNKAVQRLVPYTDSFGEIKYLKVTFDNETGWTQNSAADYDDNSPAMLYPQLTTPDAGSSYITTGDNYIDLQKDSREIINFTYQLHFVSADPNIVIGSGLAKYNPLVKNYGTLGHNIKMIIKQKTINALNRFIEVESGDWVRTQTINRQSGNIFEMLGYQVGTNYQNVHSYAYCVEVQVGEETKYELLFGENFPNGMQSESISGMYISGALMQACNQDRPNCLKFIKNGTTRYTQAYTSGLIPVPIPLTLDVDGTYSGDDILLGATVYVVDRFIKGGSGQYHAFVQIPGESGYYVKYEDIVTAYDFE